jgi:hypothetical protein
MRVTLLLDFITHNIWLGGCTNREAPHHVNFPQPPVTSSLLVPNWFPRVAFSNTPLTFLLSTFHNRTEQAK